jgi:hypothetical protein
MVRAVVYRGHKVKARKSSTIEPKTKLPEGQTKTTRNPKNSQQQFPTKIKTMEIKTINHVTLN